MLGLRFYACEDCETVHADVGVPPACGRCDGGAFREITRSLGTDTYFFTTTDDRAGVETDSKPERGDHRSSEGTRRE